MRGSPARSRCRTSSGPAARCGSPAARTAKASGRPLPWPCAESGARGTHLCGAVRCCVRPGVDRDDRARAAARRPTSAAARRRRGRRASPSAGAPARHRRGGGRRQLARIARSAAPARLLVGVRAHEDMDAVGARAPGHAAPSTVRRMTGVIAATVPSGRLRRGRASRATRAWPTSSPTRGRGWRPTSSTRVDPGSGIKFTWAYDAVRAGEAIAAVGRRFQPPVAVVDTGLDVKHPGPRGPDRAPVDTSSGRARRDRLRRPRDLRDRSDRRTQRQRARRQGRGRQHEDRGGARLARRAASPSGTCCAASNLDPRQGGI